MPRQQTQGTNRRSCLAWLAIPVVLVAVLVISVAILFVDVLIRKPRPSTNLSAPQQTNSSVQSGPLPETVQKQKPTASEFNGCPPEGDGGDKRLNRSKNRTDEGDYIPTGVTSILDLKWPQGIEGRNRSKWSRSDTADIEKYEGL